MPSPIPRFHTYEEPGLGPGYYRLSPDARALKAAADRLALLLNDLKAAGFGVERSDRGWGVVPSPADGHAGACAVVDDPHGYWDTTEMRVAFGVAPAAAESLADRLRAIAAELEAL